MGSKGISHRKDEHDQGGAPPLPWIRRLLRDRTLHWAVPALILIPVPYFLPLLSEEQKWWWDAILVNLLLYGIALIAALVGAGRVESGGERRFWRFLALALGSILLVYLAWALGEAITPMITESVGMELFSQAGYLAFYLFFALALDANRAVQEGPVGHELQWIRAAGLGVLFAGILAYFAVVPVLVHWEDPVAWVPILLIYASLDLLLCLQALRIRSKTRERRWRGILGWMALVLGSFAFVDFFEAADYAGLVDLEILGGVIGLQWYIPVGLLIFGARIQLTGPPARAEDPDGRPPLLAGGPLLLFAGALPVFHFVLYATDVLDPETRALREVVALSVLLLGGSLAFLYQLKVEQLNRVTHGKLRASQERYSSFVETSVEGIFLFRFDPPIPTDAPPDVQLAQIFRQGTVVECNEAMAVMYGFGSAAEMEGMSLGDLLRRVKDSTTNIDSTRRFVAGGYRVLLAPLEFIDAQGTRKHFEGSLVGAVEDGFLVRAWATQVDVTARFEAEREKERLEEQLRRSQRLETIGTLAGGIAHDFNNILTPILGFAELAEESISEGHPEALEYLGQIKIAATRAKNLIGQILAVGQRRHFEYQPVQLRIVVEEALQLLRQTVPSTVRFETGLPHDIPPVLADPAQLHQIVMNLCTNAVQALTDSKGTIRVEVARRRVEVAGTDVPLAPGEYVVLTVTDDGSGMSQEALNRAFEPFFTTKQVGKGTGLGLSVTHGIVKGHKGHIEIESHVGSGTKVTVHLPATAAETPDPAIPVANAEGAAPPRAPAREVTRVLLVDDEKSVARTGEAMLRRIGHEVRTFSDSRQARECLEANPYDFDVLVTDHTMPDLTGAQLAEIARALNPGIGVVVASGHSLGGEDGSRTSVVYIQKPYSVSDLRASVERALGSARTGSPPDPAS